MHRPTPDLHDLPELGRARGWWQKHRYREALRAFEKIAAKHPRNVPALADTARALGQRLEIPRANLYLEKLESICDRSAAGLLVAAESHLTLRQASDAIRCFHKALELAPDHPDILLPLAAVLERTNDCSAAEEITSAHAGQSPEWQIVLARLAMRRRAWDSAIALLQPLTARSQPLWIQTEALARLAQIHDRMEQFEKAFDFTRQRAARLQPHAAQAQKRAAFEEHHLKGLLDSLSATSIEAWLGEPDGTVLFTGPARSGTTLAMRFLQAHPDIAVSDEREIISSLIMPELTTAIQPAPEKLSERHLDALSPHTVRRLGKLYQDSLRATSSPEARIRIDKSPSATPLAPLFLRVCPSACVIHARRDPRDVLVSCLLRDLPLNSVSCRFLDPLEAAERIQFERHAWRRLHDLLPQHRAAEIEYESLVDDPSTTLAPIFRMLGIEAPGTSRPDPAPGEWINSPTYAEVLEPVTTGAIGRWKNYEPYLAKAFERLRP